MPSDPSLDLSQMLITDGIASSSTANDWNVVVGVEPNAPHRLIRCLTLPGGPPDPKWLLDTVRVEITVRGKKYDYAQASIKAQAVKDDLLGKSAVTVNGSRYIGMLMPTDIQFLGTDDNDRPLFVMNFQAWRKPSSSSASNRQAL